MSDASQLSGGFTPVNALLNSQHNNGQQDGDRLRTEVQNPGVQDPRVAGPPANVQPAQDTTALWQHLVSQADVLIAVTEDIAAWVTTIHQHLQQVRQKMQQAHPSPREAPAAITGSIPPTQIPPSVNDPQSLGLNT